MNKKTVSFSLNENTIQKLKTLTETTNIKKSAIVEMLISDCDVEKLIQLIQEKKNK